MYKYKIVVNNQVFCLTVKTLSQAKAKARKFKAEMLYTEYQKKDDNFNTYLKIIPFTN